MKKRICILMCIAVVLLLASCATAVKGANGVPQPKWVTKVPQEPYKHYVVGYGRNHDFGASRREAQQDAQRQLSEWLSVSITSGAQSSYTEVSKDSSNPRDTGYDAQKTYEDLAQKFTDSVLAGAAEQEYWIAADGGVFVLFYVPFDDAYAQFGAFTAIEAPKSN